MTRTLWLVIAMVFGTGPSVAQEDLDARIRAYILNNPEVIVEALRILSQREAQAAIAQKLAGFSDIFEPPSELVMGEEAAPIQVVEFFDYRCGPCKTVHPKLEALVAAEPDLRVEMRHLPILSPGSERAARFALATRQIAGAQAYRRIHQRLWDHAGPLRAEVFERMARAEGLDWPAMSAAMEDESVSAQIARNRDTAIALEIVGTPAFVTRSSVSVGETDADALADLWLNQ